MTAPASLIRTLRLIHLYTGVFIAPAVLFFAITGALQTFSLHETTKGSSYQPPQWMVTMGQLHKKQTVVLPPRRISLPTGSPSAPKPQPPRPEPAATSQNLLPTKIFFLVVAIGLVTSTFTGIYMAQKFTRNKLAIWATLIAGAIIPVALILLA